ncbi:MAG: hypothetical protein MUF12_00490 [Sediminibacterium sp.]|nr:hypothetical protein [Sediminibacterium sp.]
MKNKLIGALFALLAVVLGIGAVESYNPIEGLVSIGAAVTSVAHLTNYSLTHGTLFCLSLSSLPRSECQKPNPGGNRKFLVIACEDFTAEWPKEADIDTTTGLVTVAPPLAVGKNFVEIAFTDNTAKADYAKEGDEGHQSYKHMAECKLSGYNGKQYLALKRFLNMRFVLIAKHGDKSMVVYGTSEDGLSMKETHTTGSKGNDKREFTLKMEQDGLDLAPPILASTVTVPVLAS